MRIMRGRKSGPKTEGAGLALLRPYGGPFERRPFSSQVIAEPSRSRLSAPAKTLLIHAIRSVRRLGALPVGARDVARTPTARSARSAGF